MLYASFSTFLMAATTLLLGYLLQNAPPYLLLPLWYGGGALAGLLFILRRGTFFQDNQLFLKYKIHTAAMLFWGVLNGVCWFLSIYYIGVSGHAIIGRSSVIFSLILGIVLYKEKLTFQEAALVLIICAAGFVFIGGAEGTEADMKGVVLGIVNAIALVAFSVHQKYISDKIDSLYIISLRAGFIALATVMFLCFCDPNKMPMTMEPHEWALGFCGGILGTIIVHYTMTKAYRDVSFTLVTLIRSLGVMLAFMGGVLILGEESTPLQWLMSCVAIAATYVLSILKKKEAVKGIETPVPNL